MLSKKVHAYKSPLPSCVTLERSGHSEAKSRFGLEVVERARVMQHVVSQPRPKIEFPFRRKKPGQRPLLARVRTFNKEPRRAFWFANLGVVDVRILGNKFLIQTVDVVSV